MKMQLKVMSAVAAAVGLSLSMPLFAADKSMESKGAMASCDGLKGDERAKCRKEARVTDDASSKAKGAQATGSSEVGGKAQKSPTGADREKTSLPTAAPKGASEVAGEAKGTSKVDRASDKGGAMSPAPAKGTSETAGGDDKKGKGSMAK